MISRLALALGLLIASPSISLAWPSVMIGGGESGGGGGGDPAITYENSAFTLVTTNETNHTIDVTSLAIPSGNTLAVIVCTDTTGVDITFTCPESESGWEKEDLGTGAANGGDGVICVKTNTSGSETTLTTVSSSAQESVIFAIEFSDADDIDALTCSAGGPTENSGGTADATSTAMTAAASADQMLRIFCADSGRLTNDTGFPTECDTGTFAGFIKESQDGNPGGAGGGGVCIDDGDGTGAVTWSGILSQADGTSGESCTIND